MINPEEAFRTLPKVQGVSTALWTVPADLAYFNGHFPNEPIFPAVGIVDATLIFLAGIVGYRIWLESLRVAKFLSPIQPGQQVKLAADQSADGEWLAEWKDPHSEKLLASLRLRIRPA